MPLKPQVYLVGGLIRDIYITGFHGLATPTVQLAELALFCYFKHIPVPLRLAALQKQVAQLQNMSLEQLQDFLRHNIVDCSFSPATTLLKDYQGFLAATDMAQAGKEFERVFVAKDYDWDYALEGFTFAQLEEIARQEPRLYTKAPFYLRNEKLIFVLNRRETKIAPGFNGFSYDMHQVSVAEDCLRRDLTINAFYLPLFDQINVDKATDIELVLLEFDKLIDASGQGVADLEQKILRPVTEQGFLEDPIRGLRALYFAQIFRDFNFCVGFPFNQYLSSDLQKTYHTPTNVSNFYWQKFIHKGVLNRVLSSGVQQDYFNLFSHHEWEELLQANPELWKLNAKSFQAQESLGNSSLQLPQILVDKYQKIKHCLTVLASLLDKILTNYLWLISEDQTLSERTSTLAVAHQEFLRLRNRLSSEKLQNTAYGYFVEKQYGDYILDCYYFKKEPLAWNNKALHSWLRAHDIQISSLKKMPASKLINKLRGNNTQAHEHDDLLNTLINLLHTPYKQVIDFKEPKCEIPFDSQLVMRDYAQEFAVEGLEISLRNQLQILLSAWMQTLHELDFDLQYELQEVSSCLLSTYGINNSLLEQLVEYLFLHSDEIESVFLLNAALLQSLIVHYKLGLRDWIKQQDWNEQIRQEQMTELTLPGTSLLTAAVDNLPYPLQLLWRKLGYNHEL